MRISPGLVLLVFAASWLLPAQSSKEFQFAGDDPSSAALHALKSDEPPPLEKLTFGVEWRLIRAGTVTVEFWKSHASVRLESAGIVSSLFKIEDLYTANFDEPYCATSSIMNSMEGKRHHEARVTYDRTQNHAFFVERDLTKNKVIRETGTDIPNCVADVSAALMKLRGMTLDPGQSTKLAMSDGRRSAAVKVDAQEREQVKTALGTYKTIRYEADLLNGIVYTRKGRAFVWITDDDRRLPVQMRLRMNFPVGTVTLQLEKEERP